MPLKVVIVFDDSLDDDVLAVLSRNGYEVMFVTASTTALNDSDFKVLMWVDNKVTIGISDSFFSREVNQYVLEHFESGIPDDSFDVIEFMGGKLTEIMQAALLSVKDPENSNLDNVLFRILRES